MGCCYKIQFFIKFISLIKEYSENDADTKLKKLSKIRNITHINFVR
jgi:uncharacterized membrane protein